MTLIDFESVKRLNASLTHIPIRTMWGMERSEKADPKDDDFRANILCQIMNDKKWHYFDQLTEFLQSLQRRSLRVI